MPFAVLGGVLLVQAALSTKTLPRLKNSTSSEASQEDNFGIMKALRIPSVLLAIISVFTASIGVGALQVSFAFIYSGKFYTINHLLDHLGEAPGPVRPQPHAHWDVLHALWGFLCPIKPTVGLGR